MSGSPQFDARTTATTGTGNFSFTHTPVGAPDSVQVVIFQMGATDDQISSVTYGGETMDRDVDLVVDAGAEVGRVYWYTLLRGRDTVPSGAQTVAITVSGAASKRPEVVTHTAGGSNVELGPTATLDVDATADPSVDLVLPSNARYAILAALLTGRDSTTGGAVGADYTSIAAVDQGAQVTWLMRRTNNAMGADTFAANWTFGADEQAIVAVSIRTVSGGDKAEWDNVATESEANPTATGNISFDYTPGEVLRGLVVFITQNVGSDDQVSGVTADGVAMTRRVFLQNTTSEPGAVYIYTLDASVPTGTLTIAITVSGSSVKHAVALGVTAYADVEVADTNTAIHDGTANPAVDLDAIASGVEACCAAALHSGANAPPTTPLSADILHLHAGDYGNQTASYQRAINNTTGPTTKTMGYTTAAEQHALAAIAIRQVAGAANPQPPRSMHQFRLRSAA